MNREINVFADWEELGGPRRMGLLRTIKVHGDETFSFEYDRDWLAGNQSLFLDPDLQLYEGPQYLPANDRPNFGLFLDSSCWATPTEPISETVRVTWKSSNS